MQDANRLLRGLCLYTVCHDCDIILFTRIFKVHRNLRLFDKLEELGHNDANTEWSSDWDSD